VNETLKVREACRRRMPLDGTDAQALEHALTITERERDEAWAVARKGNNTRTIEKQAEDVSPHCPSMEATGNGLGIREAWVREACRRRMPLSGSDAQALERLLTMTEWKQQKQSSRTPGCLCHLEEGDSPCPIHGEEEESKSMHPYERARRSGYDDGALPEMQSAVGVAINTATVTTTGAGGCLPSSEVVTCKKRVVCDDKGH
jgi:hypothetical protein